MPNETPTEDQENAQANTTAAQVITAYLTANQISVEELPELIETVFATCHKVMGETPAETEATLRPAIAPAVSIEDSITDSHLICLEDGLKFKAMRRHLMASYGLTPEAYRERWNLPDDYPMTAPAYSRKRAEIAAKIVGLGRKRKR